MSNRSILVPLTLEQLASLSHHDLAVLDQTAKVTDFPSKILVTDSHSKKTLLCKLKNVTTSSGNIVGYYETYEGVIQRIFQKTLTQALICYFECLSVTESFNA